METQPGSDTYRFVFPGRGYPGWKLSTVLPNIYRHHDGVTYGFVGVPRVDRIRRMGSGDVEVIVTDYPRKKAV